MSWGVVKDEVNHITTLDKKWLFKLWKFFHYFWVNGLSSFEICKIDSVEFLSYDVLPNCCCLCFVSLLEENRQELVFFSSDFFLFIRRFIHMHRSKKMHLPSLTMVPLLMQSAILRCNKKIRGDNSLIGWKYSFYFYFETKIYHKLHSLIMKKKEYLFHINIYFRTYFPFVCLTFLY